MLLRLSLLSVFFVFAGCGGSDTPSEGTITEYSLSEFQSRSISSDSPIGTWVAVGTGTRSYTSENQNEYIQYFAIKEYFIVKQEGNRYSKSRCDYQSNATGSTMVINGSDVQFAGFRGTLVGNTSMTGELTSGGDVPRSYEGAISASNYRTRIDYEMVKISDAIEPITSISIGTTSGITTEMGNCFSQSNGYLMKNDTFAAQYQGIKGFYLELESWEKGSDFTYYENHSFLKYYQNSSSAKIALNIEQSSLGQEQISFTVDGEGEVKSGTIDVVLP